MLGTCPVTLDCVWVDGHSLRVSSWDVSVSVWQETLPRCGESLAGTYWAVAQAYSSDSFSDLSPLFGACAF